MRRVSANNILGHRRGVRAADVATRTTNETIEVRNHIDDFKGFFRHFKPNVSQQKTLLHHIVSRSATKLVQFESSVLKKDIITEYNWTLDTRVQRRFANPFYVIVVFFKNKNFINKNKTSIHFTKQVP